MSRLGGHAGWVAGASVAAASVVLAVVVPASWWGVTFALGVAVALVGARRRVSAAYATSWTRTTVVATLLAAGLGAVYATVTEPWGPQPAVYVPVALLLVFTGAAALADAHSARWGGRLTGHRNVENPDRGIGSWGYRR